MPVLEELINKIKTQIKMVFLLCTFGRTSLKCADIEVLVVSSFRMLVHIRPANLVSKQFIHMMGRSKNRKRNEKTKYKN